MVLDKLVATINQFSKLSRLEQKRFLDDLVATHPTLNVNWGPGHYFRRVRALRPGQWPKGVEDVIWEKGIPAKPGRINPTGMPVVYLSDRQDTALREARIKKGWALIAEFEIQPGHSIFICPIGELFQIVRTGRGFLSGDASKDISDVLNACPLHESRSLIIADAFLYEQIVGHDDYDLSSYVASAIFKKLPHISAIAYRSRQQLDALNLAVKGTRFWRDWGLISARRAFAEHLALGFYKISRITHVTGVYNSGKFQWSGSAEDIESRVLLAPPFFPLDS